jgi:hypothetical protein
MSALERQFCFRLTPFGSGSARKQKLSRGKSRRSSLKFSIRSEVVILENYLTNQHRVADNDSMAARKKKSSWGGRREGSGRKRDLRNPKSFTGELERADVDFLATIAEERGVSVASLVRAAVAAYVKRLKRR